MKLERRTPILYPIGLILITLGVVSFCTGIQMRSIPDSKPTAKIAVCDGARETTVVAGRYENIVLSTDCWSGAVNTANGKGQILTEARIGGQYIAYCSNGAQINGRDTMLWHNQSSCPAPLRFRAVGRPLTLSAKQYPD